MAMSQTQIGNDIDGSTELEYSGFSTSLSFNGNIIAIGEPRYSNNGLNFDAGRVRVYENIAGVWSQIGNSIDSLDSYFYTGWSVSLSSDGSLVAIGIYNYSENGLSLSGAVQVYENVSGVWSQVGNDIDGEAMFDQSGTAISLSSNGNIIAIGANRNDGNGENAGHVRVYENISGVWTQMGSDIDGEDPNDELGKSLSLSSNGNILAIGTYKEVSPGIRSGHVRVYENTAGVWTQIGSDIDGEFINDEFGSSISLSSNGDIVAIGAPKNNGSAFDSGSVRIFKNISGVWTQFGSDIDGESFNDQSGSSVSLSSDGNVVAIGAYRNDANGIDSGHVRLYDLTTTLSSDDFVLNEINIYPNPVTDVIRLNLNSADYTIYYMNLYNYLGHFIKGTIKSSLDVSEISSGIYLFEVITDKGKLIKKLIIE